MTIGNVPKSGLQLAASDVEEIALSIWSPYADRFIGCSAQEFNDREESNPESMEALFEAMDFEKQYTFVIKKIHNKEYDKYEMKIVYIE